MQCCRNEEIAVSFNGGKDCTVLLHLICAAMIQRAPSTSSSLNAIYVRCDSPFPQVEEFIELSCVYYNLSLHTITSDMRSALTTYQKKLQPKVKAVIVGTRRSDPHGRDLGDCNRTDVEKGWPDLMRVHPILDWSYQTVWDFLRCESLGKGKKGVPYCNLYDYGYVSSVPLRTYTDCSRRYTSLGSTHDTFPNPTLRSSDHMSLWKPAYMLQDETMERAGREGTTSVQKHESSAST